MKKKSLTIYPTVEQYEAIRKMMLEDELKTGIRKSVSLFIVDTFLPSPNGSSPPSVSENVSPPSEDTDSKQKNDYDALDNIDVD